MTTSSDDLIADLVTLRDELGAVLLKPDQHRRTSGDVAAAAIAEIEALRKKAGQRGARMQLMREWMNGHGGLRVGGGAWKGWDSFVFHRPEAADWFDEDGVPR